VQQVTQKNRSNLLPGLARFLRTQQRASTIHSTTLTFHAHTPEEAIAVLAHLVSLHI